MAVAVRPAPQPGIDRSAVRAELGAIRWGPVAGAGVAAAALAMLDLTVWRGGPGSLLTWLSAALAATAAALALDQPAAAVTAAAPYSGNRRLAARLLVAAAAGACWAGYAGLVASDQPSGVTVSWGAVTTAGVGLILLGPAVAVLLAGPDSREPGSLAGSLVVAVVIGLMTVSLPHDLHPLDVSDIGSDATRVWGAVTILSVSVLAWAQRP